MQPLERHSVAVVTGAAGGIGQALVEQLAWAGWSVALLDLDGETVAEAARALGEDGLGIACDVTDPAACEAAIEQVVGRWGGVDLMICNAGITHRSLAADTDHAVLRRVMDVNFFGAVHCARAALPSLVARRGAIVAVSSVAGFAPLVGRAGYAASKHALHGYFDSLRAELHGAGVDVVVACPSFVATDIDAHALGGDGAPAQGDKPLVGRPATPQQVASVILGEVANRRSRCVRITPVARLAWWVSRLAPRVYERMMRSRVAGEYASGEPAATGRRTARTARR